MTTIADRSDIVPGDVPGDDVTAVDGEVRRRELAVFLRSRRERLSPEDVGLAPAPDGVRRDCAGRSSRCSPGSG